MAPVINTSIDSKVFDVLMSPTKHKHALKIKTLKQKHRRLKKKYLNLKDFLNKNQHLIESTERDFLQLQYEGNCGFLFNNELRNIKLKSPRYEDEIKKFSLTLHYYSPKAYNYCRFYF